MAGPVQAQGSSGYQVGQVYGGRKAARDQFGNIWLAVSEASGVTVELVVYLFPGGRGAAIREVVRAASSVVVTAIAVCLDTSDQLVVAYTEASATTIKVSRRESGTWTAKAAAATFDTQVQAFEIECTAAGVFEVVFGDYRSSATLQYARHNRSTSDLVSWLGASTIESQTNAFQDVTEERRVAAEVDRSNNVHAVCAVREASAWPIKYAKYSSGSWSARETVHSPPTSPSTYQPKHLALAVDANDVPHVAWVMQTRTSHSGYTGVYYANRIGGTWSTPIQVHNSAAASCTMPSISVDQNGNVDVFFIGDVVTGTTYGYNVVYRARSVNSGASFSCAVVADLGLAAKQPEVPHSWRPDGHGFADSGFVVFAATGAPYVITSDDAPTFVMEPSATNGASGAQVVSTAGTPINASSGASGSQTVTVNAEKNAAAQNTASGAHKLSIPFASSGASGSQTIALNGTIRYRAASNSAGGSQRGERLQPVTCETDYEPDPAIPATDSELGRTFLAGPYPLETRRVKLPLPDYGDDRTAETRVKTLQSRHGEAWLSRATTPRRSFNVRWSQLSRIKSFEIADFLETMAGQVITYTDANGHRWRVLLTSPAASVRRDTDYFAGALELSLFGFPIT